MNRADLKDATSPGLRFLAGMIVWNVVFVIVGLGCGYGQSAFALYQIASLTAVVHLAILGSEFATFRMDRSILAGAIAGGITSGIIVAVAIFFSSLLREHAALWALTALYAGSTVGALLSYFHRKSVAVVYRS